MGHKGNAWWMLVVLLTWTNGTWAQPAPTQAAPTQAAPTQPVAPVEAAPAPAPVEAAPPAAAPVEAAPPVTAPVEVVPPPPVIAPAEEAPAEAVYTEEMLPEATLPEADVTTTQTTSNEDEIVVTGTRIKRKTAFAPSAPVDVIDRKQLEYRGAANLSELVQYLSVAQGSGYDGDAAGAGTASINLRGLGAGATLVLINGRRMHYSAGGIAEHFGDISTIPMAAVERIEILKGGASAIYGSDAVAGVVNVITRKNFNGARFELSGQGMQDMSQSGYTGSAAFGSTSERSRVLGSVQYGRSTELLASELDWTEGRYWNPFGQPGSVSASGGSQADPGCADGERSRIANVATGTLCQYDQRDYLNISGSGERAAALITAEYDITDHTTAFSEVLVSRLRGDGSYYTFPVPAPYPIVPAEHVDNHYDQDVQFIGRPFDEAQRNTADDDTFRGVIGLKGDLEGAAKDSFLEAWEWELFASYGISRYRNLIHDSNRQALQDALNSCSDPSDLSGCFNPFSSAYDGTGTPNSRLVKARIMGEMEVLNDHALQTYSGGLSGPIVELPGGDLGLALGAEVRQEWRSTEIDQTGNLEGYSFVLGNTDALASRDVYSGYLEARWPFYDGIELQTAGRAERYTDIDRTGISPSLGLTVTPSEIAGRENTAPALRKLQFRAHGTRAFRAPTIYQSFPGKATVPAGVTLPGSAVPTFIPVTYAGNPDLEEEKAWAFSTGFAWQPIDELGLTSDFWYYHYRDKIFQLTPSQIAGEHFESIADGGPGSPRVEVDPISGDIARINSQQINVQDPIITYGIDFGVMVTLTGKTFGGNENDWGKLGIGASGTYTISYEIPFGRAAQRVLPDATTLPPADCDGDRCEVVGKRNDSNFAPPLPVLKTTLPITYENSGHAISLIPRIVTGIKDDAVPPQSGEQRDISPWTTVDVGYGYTINEWIGKELTLRVGVLNVADTPPPFTKAGTKTGATAFEPLLYDPRGRLFYASAIAQF